MTNKPNQLDESIKLFAKIREEYSKKLNKESFNKNLTNPSNSLVLKAGREEWALNLEGKKSLIASKITKRTKVLDKKFVSSLTATNSKTLLTKTSNRRAKQARNKVEDNSIAL